MASYKDKLKSLSLRPSKAGPKRTIDRHDHHVVEVTTSDNRQDVKVHADPLRYKTERVN